MSLMLLLTQYLFPVEQQSLSCLSNILLTSFW